MVAIETPHDSFRKVFTHPFLQGLVLTALAFVIALWVQVPGRFPDPDSFYHAAMAEMAAQGKFPSHFPWLELTTLRDQYADLHLLYHLILVPFVVWLGPMSGIRIATITTFVLLALTFFILLRQLRLRGAFVWTLLLLGTASFVFRASLAKSQGFAFIILFIGLLALLRRSRLGVFLTAVFAVWLSSHWPVFAAAVFVFAFYHLFATVIGAPRQWRIWLLSLRESAELLVSVILGIAAGFIVNPYFPGNFTVAWQQIAEIALIGGRQVTNYGVEWHPLLWTEFIKDAGFLLPVLGLALLGTMAAVINLIKSEETDDRDQVARALTFGTLTTAFAIMTLNSQRHIEFFVPLAILFAAIGCQSIIPWFWTPKITVGWRRPGTLRRFCSTLVLILLLIGFSFGAGRELRLQRAYFEQGRSADYLRGAGEWLRKNAPTGVVVFHADWSDFPALFLWDREQRYQVGLDPRFACLKDCEKFNRWLAVGRGEVIKNTAAVMRNEFDAAYALTTPKQSALDGVLQKDRHAKLVYQDAEANVYELRM